LIGPDLGPNAWRTFQFSAEIPIGEHRFVSRAIDAAGEQQPEGAEQNHRGYGHNGWKDHALRVRAVAELPRQAHEPSAPVIASMPVATALPAVTATLSDQALAGKQLFNEALPGCGVCHSLADANALGVVGPNLNTLKPSLAQVQSAITQGVGAMPAYGAQLSVGDIEALAAYVVESTQ
jgi:mono/diheme cytochrome c family protein